MCPSSEQTNAQASSDKPKNKKKTLQQKLAERKYRPPCRFITFLYRYIAAIALLPKYNPHIRVIDDINKREGPAFLIWNHLSRVDHLYTMRATYPTRYNMVCGYSEFFRLHLYLVFRLNQILPKKVFTQDFSGMRAMHSILKQNGVVTFSPEGMSSIYGCNQPVVPGTGRFLKHYGVPVYCMRMRGQYLTSTKHYLEERKGYTDAELFLLYSAEQLKEMSPEEIENGINSEFRHDEFAWNKEHGYHWKMHGRAAEHLHEICYACPRCGKILTMQAQGDEIRCSACGNGARVDDTYAFVPFDETCVLPESPTKWVEQERVNVIRAIRKDPSFTFTEHVRMGKLPEYKYIRHMKTSVPCGEGDLTWDHQGIHYNGTRDGEPWSFDLSYETVYSLVIMTSTAQFAFYVGEDFYEFFPDRPSTGYALLITEEMHRLHVNTWKNFPWNDWMYLPEEADAEQPANGDH